MEATDINLRFKNTGDSLAPELLNQDLQECDPCICISHSPLGGSQKGDLTLINEQLAFGNHRAKWPLKILLWFYVSMNPG